MSGKRQKMMTNNKITEKTDQKETTKGFKK